MTDLIAKLEAAEVGSRELSVDILHAIGWTPERFSHIGLRWVEPGGSMTAFEYETDLPLDPSRSLDAALTLMPQTACNFELYNYIGHGEERLGEFAWAFKFNDRVQLMGERAANEEIERLRRQAPDYSNLFSGPPRLIMEKAIAESYREFHCECAATPALALCIAIMKARLTDAPT